MSPDSVIDAAGLIFRYPPEYARTLIALRMLDLPRRIRKRLTPDVMYDLVQSLSWMKLDEVTKPPFDRFTHGKTRYFLPKQGMVNASAIEYALADETLSKYMESRDDADLRLLIATLCRPAKRSLLQVRQTGDVRIPLINRNEAEERAEAIEDLDQSTMAMVMLFFAGCRRQIHDTYADWIFKVPEKKDDEEDQDDQHDTGETGDGPMFGWWSIYMDIAESGVFGKLRDVHQANFHEICMYLVQKKKQYIDRMAEIQRQKRNAS